MKYKPLRKLLKYREADRAEREGDYGKVAELRYGKIKAEDKLVELQRI